MPPWRRYAGTEYRRCLEGPASGREESFCAEAACTSTSEAPPDSLAGNRLRYDYVLPKTFGNTLPRVAVFLRPAHAERGRQACV